MKLEIVPLTRPNYTYKEITFLIKSEIKKNNETLELVINRYSSKYDINYNKANKILNQNKVYTVNMLKMASEYLGISFKELTSINIDEPFLYLNIQKYDKNNKYINAFCDLVNCIFEEIIRQNRENLNNVNIKHFNLTSFEKKIIKFPNKLGISKINIKKSFRNKEYDFIYLSPLEYENQYLFPKDFKNDLLENYKNNTNTKNDVNAIFNIFNEPNI